MIASSTSTADDKEIRGDIGLATTARDSLMKISLVVDMWRQGHILLLHIRGEVVNSKFNGWNEYLRNADEKGVPSMRGHRPMPRDGGEGEPV
jgi:hypothetical protein